MPKTPAQINVIELRKKVLNNYAAFAELFQDDGWFDETHRKLCHWIQFHALKAIDMKRDGKLLVVMPRGSLKSTVVTKYFPAWVTLRQRYLFNDDSVRSLIASSTMPQARNKLDNIRSLCDTPLFKALFADACPTRAEKWTTEAASFPRQGSYPEATFESAGMRTKKTGSHYNIIIEDDTVAPDEDEMTAEMTLPSTKTIERAIGWHKASIPLYVPKGISINLIVTTRWREDDIVDYVFKNETFVKFDVPAFDKDENPLFSCIYPMSKLEERRKVIGDFMFSCLYLNRPLDSELNVFQRSDVRYIKQTDIPSIGEITIAVDPAISEKDEACETAITVVQHYYLGTQPNKIWHEDHHGKYDPFAVVKKMLDLAEKYSSKGFPVILIVETVAYQAALKPILWDEMTRRGVQYDIIDFNSRKSKDVRIQGMQPWFSLHRIYFTDKLTDQVESQLFQYPHGKLVDIIDCFSMHNTFDTPEKTDKEIPPPKDSRQEILAHILARQRHTPNSISSGLHHSQSSDAEFEESLFSSLRSGVQALNDTTEAMLRLLQGE